MFTSPKMHASVTPAVSKDTSRDAFSYFVVSGLEYRKILSLFKKQQVFKTSVFTANIRLETVMKKEKLEHLV